MYADLNYLELVKPDAVDVVFDGNAARATLALESAYRQINDWLGGVEQAKVVPVGTLPDGQYPEALRRLNALVAIYEASVYYGSEEWGEEMPPWLTAMAEEIERIKEDIAEGRVNLGYLREQGETGIDPPYPYGTVFYNNWDSGVYTGNYEREYIVEALSDVEFRYSNDGGETWEYPSSNIGTAWIDLEYGIKVRWCAGYETSMGTQWVFSAYPVSPMLQNTRRARVSQFLRG